MNNQMDQIPEFSESPEQKRTTSGKFNLRKSLAWDKAFFTSEGVLDPEELAVVNGSYKKTEFPTLLGIQEEMRTSADSASTLDNDSWALENLEIDLFENVRASIQKSYGNSNKSSSMADCSRTRELEKSDVPHIRSSRKVEHSSQNMMKPLNALKRPGVSKQRQEDTSKEVSLCPQVVASKTEHSKSLLRPPRITSKASHLPTVPSKRASDSRSIQLKCNTTKALSDNATDRQSLVCLKKPHLDTRTVIPRALSSPKSSGLSVGSMAQPPFSSSSHKNSNNSSSSSKGQSLMETTRRKNDARNSFTGSNSKVSLRASKSKIGFRNASNSLMRSSSVSPSSSIDSAVSESSSTSTVLKTTASKQGSDVGFSSSPPSFAAPFDVPQPSAMCKFSTGLAKNGNSAAPQRQRIPKTTSAINVASQPSAGDHAGSDISNRGFNCSKPSGLRMPSLKFGYFDAEKTLVENSRKHSHIGMGINSSKASGVGNIPEVNKPRSSELHSIGPGAQDATLNCTFAQTQLTNFPSGHCIKAASATSPYLPEPTEVQATSGKTVEKHNSCSKGNKDSSPMTGEGNYLKDYNEAIAKLECGNVFNLSVEENANHTNLKSVISDLKSTDGSLIFSDSSIQEFYKVGEEGKGHLESDMHSVANPVNLEKENLIPEDQTAGLSKHLMSEKVELELVEFLGKQVSSLCLNETRDLNIDEDLESSACAADTLTQKKFNMLPNPSPLS